jgi:hypothetical protein
MRSQRLALATVLGALSLVTACGGKAEALEIRLRLHEHDSWGVKMIADQKIVQTIMGQQQETHQRIAMEYTMDVKEVDPDGTSLALTTYDRVQIRQEGPMGKTEFDSSDPPETPSPLTSGYGMLVGKTVSMRMSPKGQVLEVRGLDAILSEMLEESDLPDEMRATMERQMKEQFGDEAALEMMRDLFLSCPEKPVRPGDTWKQEVALSKPFPMIIDNTYRLRKRKKGVLEIEVDSKVRPNPKGKPMEMGAMTFRYDIEGEQEGTMTVQEDTGMILQAAIKQKMSGEMKLADATEETEALAIPMSLDGTLRMESFSRK